MGVGRVGQCPKLCAYVSLARWKRASLTQPLCNRNRSESGLGPHDEARRPVLWVDADQNVAPIEIDKFFFVCKYAAPTPPGAKLGVHGATGRLWPKRPFPTYACLPRLKSVRGVFLQG